MAMTPFTVEGFGGLNLGTDALDIGATGAVELSNVDLDLRGTLRTRPGLAYVDADDDGVFGGTIFRVLSPNVQGTGQFEIRQLAANSSTFAEYQDGTVTTTSVTGGTTGWVDILNFSGAADLVQDQTGTRAWDAVGHTLGSAISGTPKSGYLGYKPDSGRVVVAGANMSALDPDRVNFFDPGASTFTSDNWVSLETGRERITGVATVGNTVVVFKESRAFVFYGESTDADGGTVFNFQPVNLGDRIRPRGPEGHSPPGRFGTDGQYIYFVATRGVYRFTSGGAELISGDMTPIFRGEVSGFAGFDTANTFACATQDRVYVSSDTAEKTLVLEKATGQWTVYGFGSSAMDLALNPRSVYMTYGQRLALLSPASTTDFGTGIDWSYKSGRYPLADAGTVAVSVQSSVVGSGTVALRLDSDLYSNQNGSATLGTAPATAEGWPAAVDQEGTWLQHTLSGTGAATVSRLTHYVSSVKPVGVR